MVRKTLVSFIRNWVVNLFRVKWSVFSGLSGQFAPVFPPPKECPYCHVHISPSVYALSKEHTVDSRNTVVSIWECSNQECNKPFAVEHFILHDGVFLGRYLSGTIKVPKWPEFISNLPNALNKLEPTRFIDIYRQSIIAEQNSLNELAGIGYRKAFEILIKDWVLQSNPEQIEKLKDMSIANVINTHFNDEFKKLCERLIWLGNDHAHYSCKFDEYGLGDIKDLIKIIVSELDLRVKKNKFLSIEHRK